MTVELRPAAPSHADLLFEWVNDPSSLSNKQHTSGPILRVEHDKWYAARLADSGTRIWIVMQGETPVGQLRLQIRAGDVAAEVDIFIEPACRGRGIAENALRQALSLWGDRSRIEAVVMAGNAASHALFRRAGFKPHLEVVEYTRYVFDRRPSA